MGKKVPLLSFQERADEVRAIAKGLFDRTERRKVMRFVADCEAMAAMLPALTPP